MSLETLVVAFAHANKPKRVFVSHMSNAWCPLYSVNELKRC